VALGSNPIANAAVTCADIKAWSVGEVYDCETAFEKLPEDHGLSQDRFDRAPVSFLTGCRRSGWTEADYSLTADHRMSSFKSSELVGQTHS
jgi:hypothetical protein